MAETSSWSNVSSLLEELVCLLVDDPEQVQVRALQGSQSTVLEVSVAKSDFGKLIGKRGCRANAIRQLLVALSGAHDRRFLLELLEPHADAPTSSRGRPPVPDAEEGVTAITGMLQRLVELLVDHPASARVTALPGSQVVVFEVGVDPEDVPRLIGGNGRTATAIRELLVAISGKFKRRLILDITEPSRSGRPEAKATPSPVGAVAMSTGASPSRQEEADSGPEVTRRSRRVWEPELEGNAAPQAAGAATGGPGETNRAA